MNSKRLPRLLLLASVLVVGLYFAPRLPKDQTVHYILGDAAPRVEELVARWAPGVAADEDWTREASFRYAAGKAPRIVTHEPRLPDGDYTVEIEIVAANEAHQRNDVVVRKRVTLSGGATSIELGGAVPQ